MHVRRSLMQRNRSDRLPKKSPLPLKLPLTYSQDPERQYRVHANVEALADEHPEMFAALERWLSTATRHRRVMRRARKFIR